MIDITHHKTMDLMSSDKVGGSNKAARVMVHLSSLIN